MKKGYLDFDGMLCEEASILSTVSYIPCGKPAEAVVWHKHDGKHTYLMCGACADHNVRNRGAKLIATLLPQEAAKVIAESQAARRPAKLAVRVETILDRFGKDSGYIRASVLNVSDKLTVLWVGEVHNTIPGKRCLQRRLREEYPSAPRWPRKY